MSRFLFPFFLIIACPAITHAEDTDVLRGAESFRHDPRLTEIFEKIDPAKANWDSEVFHDAAKVQLHVLSELIESDGAFSSEIISALVAPDFKASGFDEISLVPDPAFSDHGLKIQKQRASAKVNALSLPKALEQSPIRHALSETTERRHAVKIESVLLSVDGKSASTDIRIQFSGLTKNGTRAQINGRWSATWLRSAAEDETPKLSSLIANETEILSVVPGSKDRLHYNDATTAVLGANKSFSEQLAWPYDHWRARMDRLMGTDFTSNQGVALADVNGDGLDDVFISQPGGLPNKLFLHQPDGTAKDITTACELDFLDFTRSALFVDFDNDGDQDIVYGMTWELIFLRNDGPKPVGDGITFTPHFRAVCPGMVYALAAADYDNDGDLDIYASGRYAHNSLASERQILGIPVPYHDANNGGRSTLWRNDGGITFTDVTADSGIDENNSRFTLAAAWEDYDNDGDQDLYVANDFGRNNLYRNDGGKFTDVAAAAGVEDIGPGMSASWGDYNNDGWMDLYVANMYSSAGRRIVSQAAFMKDVDKDTLDAFERHARGNSLYLNKGDGTFQDTTEQAGVNMGRWAWSSLFTDMNNDGLQDIVIANGFISAEGVDDL